MANYQSKYTGAQIDERLTAAGEAKAYTDQAKSSAIASANLYTDGKIGDISAALDELHAYAVSLTGGSGE